MKVTLNWLKQYVDFDWTPEELTERLTMLGLEVEKVEEVGGGFDGVVVAEVLTRDKHPDADKLSVCRVKDGEGERQIVCGADNFQAGDKVPLVLPGASLPPKKEGEKPFTIKVGKIRGVESHGMMCAPSELGLEGDSSGLMILPADATVGQPFAEHLGCAEKDVFYDLEVTPNRPDWNSVIGIAREIAALTANKLKLPDPALPEPKAGKAEDHVAVRLDDPELCPRYAARVVKGVKVGPSPDWLRNTLEKVGIRSISNVVDVTNFVMLEIGQPLHAFDYHLIGKGAQGKPTIVVRPAAEGEKFTTLDDKEHHLNAENLLIADEHKGIALAGVMGGLNTEINDDTQDVLIEAAYFNPTNIRRTSKRLNQSTDASYRFERGCDPNIVDWASRRAAQLIIETAGGELAEGVVDAYPNPVEPKTITLRHEKVNQLLGIELTNEEIDNHLKSLELENPAPGKFEIPTYRVDLKEEIDLVEEVVRLYGVDKIPATEPRGAHGSNEYDSVHDQIAEARRILTGLGLDDAQGQTLIGNDQAELATDAENIIALSYPLSSDMNVLRPSLLPGLLDALSHNLTHSNNDVSLCETGRVFFKQGGELKEERRIAIAITGQRDPSSWAGNEGKYDIHDLKGILDEFLEDYGLRGVFYTRRTEATPLFIESAGIKLGGKLLVGQIGQLQPRLGKDLKLRDPAFLAELNLDVLLQRRNPKNSFQQLPTVPGSRRDVALLLPEEITHEEILKTAKKAKADNLESVELFDIFRGQNIPEGQKSVAYAFNYRHPERTLKDKEVDKAHNKVVEQLKSKLNATVR
ncbi:MAG: phenylalanine--tRNA ligase subunit beta [Verrucomicrobiales bacterium]|nr:phenylalanine--tRNA ligase subunit beta [Verrucomicrobiales bacterium]